MPITDPADIANLTAWVEGDSITGLSDGDPIAAWPEAGPVTGYQDLRQALPVSQPLWMDAILNGHPVVEYYRSEWGGAGMMEFTHPSLSDYRSWYEIADPDSSPIFQTDGATALVIMRASAIQASDIGLMFWGLWVDVDSENAATDRNGIGIRRTAEGYEAVVSLVDGTTVGDVHELVWPVEPGDWLMIEFTHDGETLTGRLNGCDEQSVACGPTHFYRPGDTDAADLYCGWSDITAATPSLQIAALTAFDRKLTARELCDLRAYFASPDKYDLDICNPCARHHLSAHLIRAH